MASSRGSATTKSQRKKSYNNFLSKYPYTSKLTADKFAEIWDHYDSNSSGYIDTDLHKFFRDLLSSMTNEEVTDSMVKDMKDCFMASYDAAGDGRIAITELADILDTDENFILLFRREEQLASSVDFMELWRKYDKDRSGYLNSDELKNFIKDLLKKKGKKVPKEKLKEYATAMLTIFDKNGDGRLGLKEMARLLSVAPQENFLTQMATKVKSEGGNNMEAHFDKVFKYYDKSNTNAIEGDELDAFIKDLMEPSVEDLSTYQLELFKKGIMNTCDTNGDGKIQRDEIKLVLGLYTNF